jgi:TRAP-type C4-dicarboxylate transport system permease small subunit
VNSIKGIAIVLIAAGVLALAYGGFSYTKETHEGHIGSLELSVKDKEHVNVPVWAGVAAIVIGAGFLLVPNTKS